jgi:hypothetical protein
VFLNFSLGAITGRLFDKGYLYVGFESTSLGNNLTYYLSYHLIISGIIIHAISRAFSCSIEIYTGLHFKLNSVHAFALSGKCILPGPSNSVVWREESHRGVKVFLTNGVGVGLASGLTYTASKYQSEHRLSYFIITM